MDAKARACASATEDLWQVAQVLVDQDGLNDWEAVFTVDLKQSREENRAVASFQSVRQIGVT